MRKLVEVRNTSHLQQLPLPAWHEFWPEVRSMGEGVRSFFDRLGEYGVCDRECKLSPLGGPLVELSWARCG